MLRKTLLTLGLLTLAACTPVTAQTLSTPTRPPAPSPTVTTSIPNSGLSSTSALAAITTVPTQTNLAAATQTAATTTTLFPSTPTPDQRLKPEGWQEWPVIPVISTRAKLLYQSGLIQGNNWQAFSKIGDCQNINSHFLAAFDNPQLYKLGARFEYLQPAIDHFKGMFNRESAAVRNGFNVAAVLSPLQADPTICRAGENPISCELRLNHPSIVLISMETWWAKKPAQEYEKYMRQILDLVISQKALPILATKADNLEGDDSVNATLARLAYEYDIPMWNFWRAVQPLPNGGVTEDGFHLTHESKQPNDPMFYQRLSDPVAWNYGWTVRNVTALQALDSVWRQASAP